MNTLNTQALVSADGTVQTGNLHCPTADVRQVSKTAVFESGNTADSLALEGLMAVDGLHRQPDATTTQQHGAVTHSQHLPLQIQRRSSGSQRVSVSILLMGTS